jgi:hypothetical protein
MAGIKALPNLTLLNLNDCNLTWKSGDIIGDIVKVSGDTPVPVSSRLTVSLQYQSFKAVSLHWENTLRHDNFQLAPRNPKSDPESVDLSHYGLRTLFISRNPLSDTGMCHFIDQVMDVISLVGFDSFHFSLSFMLMNTPSLLFAILTHLFRVSLSSYLRL